MIIIELMRKLVDTWKTALTFYYLRIFKGMSLEEQVKERVEKEINDNWTLANARYARGNLSVQKPYVKHLRSKSHKVI